MKTIMRIFAILAMITGSVTTWHAVMPTSACWMHKQELLGCIFLAALTTIVSSGIAIILEKEK